MLVEKWPLLKVEKLKELWSYRFTEDKKKEKKRKKKELMSRVLDMNI